MIDYMLTLVFGANTFYSYKSDTIHNIPSTSDLQTFIKNKFSLRFFDIFIRLFNNLQ